VADFGIAKAYRSAAEAEIDTSAAFMVQYAAQEIVA